MSPPMAVSSNRSPSPVAARPNPNSRSSENNSNLRRSFSGNARTFTRPSLLTNPRSFNPVTPANSPADVGKRPTLGKEGPVLSRAYEEKENEKDPNLKSAKNRSPAKGSRNFMSSTISASSKFTPSPRKKILVDRNEPVRTSISLSDGKGLFGPVNASGAAELEDSIPISDVAFSQNMTESSKDSTFADSSHSEPVLEVSPIPKASRKVTFGQVVSDTKNASESLLDTTFNSDCVDVEPSSQNKYSCSPVTAPVDADQSLPPYDPKNNYLSPRPQFLHYRPNPRVKLLNPSQAKRLEHSFVSEIFSDNEFTEDTQSEDSQKDSEDDSSVEVISEVVVGKDHDAKPITPIENQEINTPEPIAISTPSSTQTKKEAIEAKRPPKPPRFLTRSKSISLVLVLLVACLSMSLTDSPVMKSPVSKDLSFPILHKPSEVVESAKANFDGFARNFRHWSTSSIPYLSKLIPGLGDKVAPLQFTNLTIHEDFLMDMMYGPNMVQHSNDRSEANELEHAFEAEVKIEPLEGKIYYEDGVGDHREQASQDQGYTGSEKLHQSVRPEVDNSRAPDAAWSRIESDIALDMDNRNELEAAWSQVHNALDVDNGNESETVWSQVQTNIALHLDTELQSGVVNFEYQSDLVTQAPEFNSDIEPFEITLQVVETEQIQAPESLPCVVENSDYRVDDDLTSAKIGAIRVDSDHESSSESGPAAEHFLSSANILGISSLVLALVIVTAGIYTKQAKNSKAVQVPGPLLSKKLISSALEASTEHVYQDGTYSQNWQTEEHFGESCSSEMSSFQKSSSYSKGGLGAKNEAQSQERKSRKSTKKAESLASSSDYSMGSPSYGSFTTYEKIANGEEEIMTPVRRSSRLKNQVTSL